MKAVPCNYTASATWTTLHGRALYKKKMLFIKLAIEPFLCFTPPTLIESNLCMYVCNSNLCTALGRHYNVLQNPFYEIQIRLNLQKAHSWLLNKKNIIMVTTGNSSWSIMTSNKTEGNYQGGCKRLFSDTSKVWMGKLCKVQKMKKEELLEAIKEKHQLFQPPDLNAEKPPLISRLPLTVKRNANQVLQQERCNRRKYFNSCLNTAVSHNAWPSHPILSRSKLLLP